jgi:hypothetical protein
MLILVFHLRPSLPSGLFPSGFPTKILYAFILHHDPGFDLASNRNEYQESSWG